MNKMNLSLEKPALSIVVPVFNEQEVLAIFHQRLTESLGSLRDDTEIIYINDGSRDASARIIEGLRNTDPRVGHISLSRNFGKEAAMSAGLEASCGQAVIIIDADLQDPPELIPSMLSAFEQGADIVNMRRRHRHGETWLKKKTAAHFYQVMEKIGEVPIQRDVGDFRLLSRRVVDALNAMPERNRFMKGLFSWVGYHNIIIEYDRDPRAAGSSKFHYWKLWNFAIEGITSFSVMPIKLASYAGFASALLAVLLGLFFLIKTLFFGDPVDGFPTLILTILFMGGLQLMAIGIMGEYVGRLFIESKQRPLYLLDYYHPAQTTRAVKADLRVNHAASR
ncbi:glycosyltransferase family 2 protein [Alcanivorax sp. 1008]|uniref:glycosyltransferase family 2 protein n=1 Tax=Alcanivorax sp. 1008 TaxID=2816853 RepID=UPI001E0ED91E|nr:glycosyltransferase family 2 protein [Alcanivorax sp. 1008]MCC1495561.1 glycosyltransferase family 2 protein [Alcanivorax sp. 1008]